MRGGALFFFGVPTLTDEEITMLSPTLRPVPVLAAMTLVLWAVSPAIAQPARALTIDDMMKFRTITAPTLSNDGTSLVYGTRPDRGDPAIHIRHTESDGSVVIPLGTRATVSDDSGWVAVVVGPTLAEREERPPRTGDTPAPPTLETLTLVNLATLEPTELGSHRQHAFTPDSRWLITLRSPESAPAESAPDVDTPPKATEPPSPPAVESSEEKPAEQEPKKKAKPTRAEREAKRRRQSLGPLVARRLSDGFERLLCERAVEFAVEGSGRFVAFVELDAESPEESLHIVDLVDDAPVFVRRGGRVRSVSSPQEGSAFAFLTASGEVPAVSSAARLHVWTPADAAPVDVANASTRTAWAVPLQNQLRWSRTGSRLFFGMRPAVELPAVETPDDGETEPLDVASLREKSGVDVWHWNDPRIVTHRKKQWRQIEQRTYRAVYHAESRQTVVLGDAQLPDVDIAEEGPRTLGRNSDRYLKEVTWDGSYHDASVVDLTSGKRTEFAKRLSRRGASLSPNGRFAVYYRDGQWHLYDVEKQSHRDLTSALDVSFADEDHDYPSDAPSYGVAGWLADDRAVLIYDKFDIWQFSTDDASATCWTAGQGRAGSLQLRVLQVDPQSRFLTPKQPVLLSAYHDREKTRAFYRATVSTAGVQPVLKDVCRFTFVSKAKDADRVLFTREQYHEFPNLWSTNLEFDEPRRLTDVNPQQKEFDWGRARLVEWRSLDGTPLQGVLIEPENAGQRPRPVMVYFYRFYSPRLHQFAHPRIGHRPALAYYVSHGYSVFMPDVRFEIGRPGLSATKCIVPGVQKLIEDGIADPDAIGLHGHSWSGYQTAFMITQTDLFKAAIAGAPVSNMTSAYGGIRWQSGLSRQFQYEKSQSRLGSTPWESPGVYLENSPLFFADRINTPLLMMFGDNDGAVPWYQGIELYMALRRLERDAILLTYRGEGHGLTRYPNRLDYCVRMKEYFDHYLRGAEAPDWIERGQLYEGK